MFSSIATVLSQLSNCSRRKELSNRSQGGNVVPRDTLLMYAGYKRSAEWIDAGRKADLAEVSTTDFSDGSEQVAGSTDWSDTDTPMIKMISASDLAGMQRVRLDRRSARSVQPAQRGRQDPPKLQPLPKTPVQSAPQQAAPEQKSPHTAQTLQPAQALVQSTSQDMAPTQSTPLKQAGTPLKSNARLFVPSLGTAPPMLDVNRRSSQQAEVRQSIQFLKSALEEVAEDDHALANHIAAADGQNLAALQEALNKLNLEEVSVVKALLDSHEAEQANAFGDTAAVHYGCGSGMMQNLYAPATTMGIWTDNIVAPALATPPGQFYPTYTPQMSAGWDFTSEAWDPYAAQAQSQYTFGKAQAKSRMQPTDTTEGESLATHLCDLAELDSTRVIMLRGTNRLVKDASESLKTYFSQFGCVERVMLSATRAANKPGRQRAATIGFLVMDTAESAQAALAHGAEHPVQGVTINVSNFQSHPIDETKSV